MARFEVVLWGLDPGVVMHVLPEGAQDVTVALRATAMDEGTVTVRWRGTHASGLPHKRRSVKEWPLDHRWWAVLAPATGPYVHLANALRKA